MDTNFDKKNFVENFKHSCTKVQIRKFIKNETVTTYIEKRNQICIVLSGEVDLVRYDFNGIKQLLDILLKMIFLVKYFILQILIMNFLL